MEKKAARGRPPRHEGELLAKNRTFRVRGELDDQLQASALKAGRSVSEEIEYRLSRSFADDWLATSYLGTDVSAEVIRMIRIVMAVESLGNKRWNDDPASADYVRDAADTIITVLAKLPLRPGKSPWEASALFTTMMLAKSPMWQSAMPAELSSYAEHVEKVLLKVEAARREATK
jgi:hypothetical protein